METIVISREPVALYKVLKFEGLASSGGEAKAVIAAGLVQVNGEVETRRRRQMLAGDQIGFGGQQFRLALQEHGN